VGPCGCSSIVVVDPHGQLSEVMVGHHCHSSMVVLGTCGHLWVVITISQSWCVSHGQSSMVMVGAHCISWGCEKRLVTCDIVIITSPNWDHVSPQNWSHHSFQPTTGFPNYHWLSLVIVKPKLCTFNRNLGPLSIDEESQSHDL